MGKVIDLSGQKFGRWNVIKLLPYRAKHRTTVYDCVCDCQLSKPEAEREHHTILRTSLTSGRSTSCGCYFREIVHKQTGAHKKFNKYDLDSYEYGIGYASNNNDLFMFDKEDYNLLKQHTWYSMKYKYMRTSISTKDNNECVISKKLVLMHQYIMREHGLFTSENQIVDHINGNPFDNRKENLRVATMSQNKMNSKIYKNNTSGCKGVTFRKKDKKYVAHISVNRNVIRLGTFDSFEDARDARLKAEQKYFKQYARNEKYINNGCINDRLAANTSKPDDEEELF